MAIYMFKGTYTDASIKAMVKKPVDRSSLISKACKAFGGKLLSIYMAFGDDDVIVIAELPDDITAAAFSAQIAVAGTASSFSTTQLLSMKDWVKACKKEDIELEDLIRFDYENKTYAIYCSPDENYFCTDGLCTHENVHLEDGLVMDDLIECPMHNGQFNYKTGKAIRSPACDDLKIYNVKVESDFIFIDIDS